MFEQRESLFTGTAALALLVAVSLWLTVSRRSIAKGRLRTVRLLVCLGIVLHICHFAEESLTGFYMRFPEFLGIAPWSLQFFLSFSLAWIEIWLLSIPLLTTYPRSAIFPIWFLALASAANGIAHPLLSVATAGYFPGLWSSPLVGILGVVLLRTLVAATRGSAASHGAP